jgi:hypothetical protein
MARSRSAFGIVARPGLAAAGICAPIATIGVLLGNAFWILAAIPAWAALVGFVVAVHRLWPGTSGTTARVTVVTAWAASMIAFVIGAFGHYAVAIDHALCGGGAGATTLAAMGAAAVYLAGSVWALSSGGRAVWAWPLLMLVGWAVHLLLLLALADAHGFCET